MLGLAYLTDVTEKLNHLNLKLQCKDKNVSDQKRVMIRALRAFKAKLWFYQQRVKRLLFPHL